MTHKDFEYYLRRGVEDVVSCMKEHWRTGIDAPGDLDGVPRQLDNWWSDAGAGAYSALLHGNFAHLLFLRAQSDAADKTCGCLTQIRNYKGCAATKALTEAICKDDRIPATLEELCRALKKAKTRAKMREVLEPFVEWQLKLRKKFHDVGALEKPKSVYTLQGAGK